MKAVLLDLDFDNWQAILLSVIPSLLNIFIFIYVRIKFPADKISKVFSLFLLALLLFQCADTFVRMSNTAATARWWNSIFMVGALMITPLGIHFSLLYSKSKYAASFLVQTLLYGPVPVLFVLTFIDIQNLDFYTSAFWGWVVKEHETSLSAFEGYWIGLQGLTMLFILVRHAIRIPAKTKEKTQAITIAAGLSIPIFQGIITEVLMPVIGEGTAIPLTSACMSFFSVAVLIALKKFGLFKITNSLKTKTILEAMTDMLIILSPDKKIQFINKEGEMALGVNNDDREYLSIDSFFAGGQEEANNFTHKLFAPTLSGEKTLNYAAEFISRSGRKIPVQISATSFKISIGAEQVLLLVHDVTDLFQTEKQLAMREDQLKDKSEELNSFFYRTTHDLKGPVASIIGLTRLASKDADAQLMMQCLEKIQTSAFRLNDILLDFIKVMHIKERETEVKLINFYKMTDNIINSIKYSIDRDAVNFKVWIEPNLMFHSDESLLDSILYNLIVNGVNYRRLHSNEESFVHIYVRGFGNGIIIRVADNGIGIRKEIQGKIFNLFFRGTEDSKGTGLGLYILKNASAKLNGRVELESEHNKGTTFSVYLPDLKYSMQEEEPAIAKATLSTAC